MNLIEEVLAAARLPTAGAASLTLEKIHTGSVSEVFRLTGPGVDLVLKICGFDLGEGVRGHPDSRLRAAARCFSIPPFFASSRERIETIQTTTRVALPNVLAEGKLPCGLTITLMERLDGIGWGPATRALLRRPERKRALSAAMGRLLREIHAADRSRSPTEDWPHAYAEILHCEADRLPSRVVGSERRRFDLHRRVARVVGRYRRLDRGPEVLAHGDFHPSNLLLGPDDSIRGLIDFQLSSRGPASLDFRWLSVLDAAAFLGAYGWDTGRIEEARWLGAFHEMLWEGLGMVSTLEFSGARLGARYWVSYMSHFLSLLDLLERDRIPLREPLARLRLFWLRVPRVALRYARRDERAGRTATEPSGAPRPVVDVVGP